MMEIEEIAEIHAQIDALEDSGEEYERQVRRCYEAILKPGDVAVDVGAYEGKHTVALGFATAPNGRVYAAEPNGGIHEVLLGRLERSKLFGVKFEMFAGCISNENLGDVSFSVVPDKVGWSSLIPRSSVDNVQELRVQTFTMDSWVKQEDHSKVRFIKVDCEGAELKVLQGAEAILAHHRAVIHLEISPDALEVHGVGIDELAAHLSKRYIALDCIGMTLSNPLELAAGFRSKGCFDFFFVSRQSDCLKEDILALKQALAGGFYGALTEGSIPDIQLSLMRDFWASTSSVSSFSHEHEPTVDFLPRRLATPSRPQDSIIHARKVPALERRQHCRVKNGIMIVRTANFEALEQIPLSGVFDFELHKNGHAEVDVRGEFSDNASPNMTMIEIVMGEDFVLLVRTKWLPEKGVRHLEGFCSNLNGFKQFFSVPLNGHVCEARLIIKDYSVAIQSLSDRHEVALPADISAFEWLPVSMTLGKRTRHKSAEPFRGKLQASLFSPETSH